MRRGSALLMALWTILVLGMIAISFSFEAKLQGGINLYAENKGRVKRLLDAGRVIGEVVLVNYENGKQWTSDEDLKQELEDDRWYVEKQALKYSKGCKIGPILLNEEDPGSGTVSVEISVSSADETGGININKFTKDSDPNVEDRWRIILDQCGVPREEINDDEGKPVNLQSYVIACWQDYRDEDDTRYDINDTSEYKGSHGAEKKEYEEYYDDHKDDFAEEDRFEPANGEIGDLKELSRVICFRKFPALLTGGALNPWDDKKSQIVISRGLMNMGVFSVMGDGKINVNRCSVDQLLTVPGIFNPEDIDDNDMTESREIAEAIVKCRTIKPTDYDVPEDETRTEWGYGEFHSDWWSDMVKRVQDEFDVDVPNDAKQYLTALPETSTVFKMKITASLMDMDYTAECECYVKDKKVRYTMWKE